MTIHKTPQVLVLHLKRFSYGNMHGKVSKHIAFSDELQVPCTGDTSKIAYYKLCGVVVHHGHSTRSGHYVAMVKVNTIR